MTELETDLIVVQELKLIPAIASSDKQDIMTELLADKRSVNTRRAYQKDLTDFFSVAFGLPATQEAMTAFLNLHRFEAIAHVLRYKSYLVARGLKEATVNRRLAAIKSLVNYARRIGKCEFSLEDITGEKVTPYRDTSGVSVAEIKRMLSVPNLETLKGIRDYAILRLLWENALRRNELASCNIGDFDPDSCTLSILGKGRGSQKELVTLSPAVVNAIQVWLELRGGDRNTPLFTSLSHNKSGNRLTCNGIYDLVSDTAIAAGINKKMSPHRIRHSAITAALDATNGNVRDVQKLSRHRNVETLMRYDDARNNAQGKVTNVLSTLV
jgi:integrase/recombinase XerC